MLAPWAVNCKLLKEGVVAIAAGIRLVIRALERPERERDVEPEPVEMVGNDAPVVIAGTEVAV